MRQELQHLENQLVFCRGRLLEKRKAPGGTVDLLLKKVRVRPWNGFDAVGYDPVAGEVHTDHLWVRMRQEDTDCELLSRAYIIGDIYYYRRANFTVDLGVRSAPALDIDFAVNTAKDLYRDMSGKTLDSAKEARAFLAEVASALLDQGSKGWAWSRYYDADTALKMVGRGLKLMHSSIEATEKRLATATRNGSCTRLDLFSAPRCKRKLAVGF